MQREEDKEEGRGEKSKYSTAVISIKKRKFKNQKKKIQIKLVMKTARR